MDSGQSQWLTRRAGDAADLMQCLEIRDVVFVHEQGVAPAIEHDGLDDRCIHYIAFHGGEPVATARVMPLADRFKFQRVAVLPRMRGTGLGAALMRFIMEDLARNEMCEGRDFFLSSQVHALAFYERLGFAVCSGEYMDAGIPHRDMRAPAQATAPARS